VPLEPGSSAPAIPGVDLSAGPTALFFYKVTCPVCQMAAPKADAFDGAYPGRIIGVGQDPPPLLREFGERHGMSFGTVADPPPYLASDVYGIEAVPTLFVVDGDGTVVETVESWDRDGYNRASRTLADLTRLPFVPISDPADGLPAFRPG
jgi:peroxiredoxin